MYTTLSRGEIASLLTGSIETQLSPLPLCRQTDRFLAGSAAPTGSARLNQQVARMDSGALSLQCAKAFIVPTPSSPDAVAHHSRNKTLVMWAMQISSYEQPIQTTTVGPAPPPQSGFWAPPEPRCSSNVHVTGATHLLDAHWGCLWMDFIMQEKQQSCFYRDYAMNMHTLVCGIPSGYVWNFRKDVVITSFVTPNNKQWNTFQHDK